MSLLGGQAMSRNAYPEMDMADTAERARLMALRSLSHCGAIMVDIDRCPRGYRLLQDQGFMQARRRGDRHALCQLNKHGLEFARKALK
jgi:succinate dehydrogenase/fumarate reductase-like Fe-S protein